MKKLIGIMLVISQLISCQPAIGAETIDVERLATAIKHAEGNDNYGILKHISGTNYRKACIQTISKRLSSWNGNGKFIVYLASTYCPVGAKNDPSNLNKNWIKNVEYFYLHS